MPSSKPKRKPSRPRTTIFRAFRLTPSEDRTLAKQAKAAGLNVSQYIRSRLAGDIEQAA